MSLDERKKQILHAIIHEYIETAEPVGSRHIADSYRLNLSSATIRNEMADLEDMGYLISPHTSSGRIPSDAGYRIYVDELMKRYQFTVNEIELLKRMLDIKTHQVDQIIRHLSGAISKFTKLPTVAIVPDLNSCHIKKLDIIWVGAHQSVIVLVTDTGVVRNRTVMSKISISEDKLHDITRIINTFLTGKALGGIDEGTLSDIVDIFPQDREVIAPLLASVIDILKEITRSVVYLDGISNVLTFSKTTDTQRSKELLDFIEDRTNLVSMLGDYNNDSLVTISIGKENHSTVMQDYSVVISNYSVGAESKGQIGIIGPTRMNYSKLIPVMEQISHNLNNTIESIFEKQSEEEI